MKFALTVTAPSQLNPGHNRPSQRNWLAVVRAYIAIINALTSGAGIARRAIDSGRQVASISYSIDPAIAGITVASPANAATVTLNGQALTGGQKRASCTVTFSSVANNDNLTVNGVVFTAKTTPTVGNLYQFQRGGTDTADAGAFVAALNAATINASDSVTAAGVYGKIEASNSAGVVTLYAITEGTAGNSYSIVTSSNSTLAITNDSSGSFANGAAAANNAFDRIGNDKRTARSICNCIAASSTALVSSHVAGACRKGIVTCATVISGSTVTLDSVKLRAIKETTDSGGARVATFPDDVFGIGASDTATGDCLVNCINNHPKLRERFYATNSTGAVTIRERPPEATNPPPLVTSDGSTLAVTATVNGCLADSALLLVQALQPGVAGNAITVATSSGGTLGIDGSASRLAGGTRATFTL
jgi:hypothetical protein